MVGRIRAVIADSEPTRDSKLLAGRLDFVTDYFSPQELGVHLTEPDADLGLIQLERTLRHEVKDLETQKEEHLKEVRVLRKEDEELCQKLELEPFYVSLKVIPTQAQVEGLRKHVKELKVQRIVCLARKN